MLAPGPEDVSRVAAWRKTKLQQCYWLLPKRRGRRRDPLLPIAPATNRCRQQRGAGRSVLLGFPGIATVRASRWKAQSPGWQVDTGLAKRGPSDRASTCAGRAALAWWHRCQI